MALNSGTKLGPYEIESPLGAGGMGEVYRARDTRLDRTVAVKILPAHLSENDLAKQRFDREARAISSLSHPNICTLYDVGQLFLLTKRNWHSRRSIRMVPLSCGRVRSMPTMPQPSQAQRERQRRSGRRMGVHSDFSLAAS
jgi:serine/threonine protein kinase